MMEKASIVENVSELGGHPQSQPPFKRLVWKTKSGFE